MLSMRATLTFLRTDAGIMQSALLPPHNQPTQIAINLNALPTSYLIHPTSHHSLFRQSAKVYCKLKTLSSFGSSSYDSCCRGVVFSVVVAFTRPISLKINKLAKVVGTALSALKYLPGKKEVHLKHTKCQLSSRRRSHGASDTRAYHDIQRCLKRARESFGV